MPKRNASAVWNGDLKGGKGHLEVGSGALKAEYSFGSRFESGKGTNPEELIGAAEAGCYSMALALALGEEGFKPEKISTEAEVSIEKTDSGFSITEIRLNCSVSVADITDEKFQDIAQETKENCPVSQALSGTKIELTAKLEQ
jgi:lipoyl-dependent peroxiredoxin